MSSDKNHTFKCLDHSQRVSKKLLSFYENKRFFDIILVSGVDNVELQAHRIVLSASSEFFSRMFDSQLQEATADKIYLKDIDSITMKSIIDFMYTGEIDLHCDTIESISTAASFLQIDTLTSMCCEFMMERIDVSNCLGISLLAEQYNYHLLCKKAVSFAQRNFTEVCSEKEFLQLNAEQLGNYISSDKLCTHSEEQVFRSLVKWLQFDEENRYKFAASLLQHVRVAFLDLIFIREHMNLKCRTQELRDIIYNWMSSTSEVHSQVETLNTKCRRPAQTLVAVRCTLADDLLVSMFNKYAMTWTAIKVSPPLLCGQFYSTIIINKKMIIAGGETRGIVTNRVKCFDLDTKQWTDLPSMEVPRRNCALAELFGDLYVIGGSTGYYWTDVVEKYDFLTKKWQFVASLNRPCAWIKTTVSDEGFIYAAGCLTHKMEVYDNTKDKWTYTADKNDKLYDFGITALNGYVYAFGGRDCNYMRSTTVERYHKKTDTWTFECRLNAPSSGMESVTLNNRPIIVGGFNGSTYDHEIEEYDPERQEWTRLTSLPEGICEHPMRIAQITLNAILVVTNK